VNEIKTLHEDIKTTDTPLRYTAYSARLAQFLRYTAYTSDFGESFRPLVHRRIVQTTYGISWAYVLGDVGWEGYKAHAHQKQPPREVAAVVTERLLFQSLASMIIPAFMIHTQVKFFQKVCKRVGRFNKWGPTFAGLVLVPFLPLIIDHPVETTLHWVKKKLGF